MSLPALPFLENESLARHTSYRIGGPARYMAFPESVAHLEALASHLKKSGASYAILGNGSNLLAPDEGFSGWVIKTTKLPQFLLSLPGMQLHISAGTNNSRAIRASADLGLSGLEYLSGVPGTIGGAVFMNAGTASGWVSQNILCVEGYSLSQGRKTHPKSTLNYSYRQQHFLLEDEIVLSAQFQMQTKATEAINQSLIEGLKRRKAAQPIELPSCGSVFRNPETMSAWQCIEKVGLRGHKMGAACFSAKHCNFIVNEGGATKDDVLGLVNLAKEKVAAELGIELHEELVVLKPRTLS